MPRGIYDRSKANIRRVCRVQKYITAKKSTAKQAGREFHLTVSDIHVLLYMAGITMDDIGKQGYCLARLKDEGHYTRGNCRFIPFGDNVRERFEYGHTKNMKWSPERKAAQAERAKKQMLRQWKENPEWRKSS